METTLLILNYNTAINTIGMVESAVEINFDKKFIIIIDNDSSNIEDKKILDNYCLNHNINILNCPRNLGYGKAFNYAVKNVDTKYLCFCNSDMVFLENPFLELESFYEKSNDIGCVGIQQVFPDYSFQASYGNFLSISEVLSKIFFLNKFSSKKVSKTRSVEYVDGAFMFISSKTFRELNGFDENFFFYFEDMDLCKRLVDRGYLNFILPNNKIIHERGYSTNKRGTLISEFSIKNFNSGIFIFIDLHFKSFLYKKLYLNLLKIQCLKQIIVHFFLGRKNSKFIIAKNKDLLIAINSR